MHLTVPFQFGNLSSCGVWGEGEGGSLHTNFAGDLSLISTYVHSSKSSDKRVYPWVIYDKPNRYNVIGTHTLLSELTVLSP